MTNRNNALEVELSDLKAEYKTAREEFDRVSSKFEMLDNLLIKLQHQHEQLEETHKKSQQDWSEERTGLIQKLEEQQQRAITAEKERDLFREIYGKASSYASETREENQELQTRVTTAEGQTREEIAILKATYIEQLKKMKEEVEEWKALCHILTTKDRRTNDDIRRRAAQERELRDENELSLVVRDENELSLAVRDENERSLAVRDENELFLAIWDKNDQSLAIRDAEPGYTSGDSSQSEDHVPPRVTQLWKMPVQATKERDGAQDELQVKGVDYSPNTIAFICQHVSGTILCSAMYLTVEVCLAIF